MEYCIIQNNLIKYINVKGSNVIGVGDVNILALENANIDSVTEKTGETHIKKVKKSGFLSGGGFGFTIGSQSSTDSLQKVTATQKGSTVGSVAGDVNITTGEKLNVTSSDIIAGGNINLTGSEVKIDAASDTYTYNYKHEEKMKGISVGVSGGLVGMVDNKIFQPLKHASEVNNDRLKNVMKLKAVYDTKDVADEVNKFTDGSGRKMDIADIGIGVTSSKYTYKEQGSSTTAKGSGITAKEDVVIIADDGKITAIASKVNGNNIYLYGKYGIEGLAAENISIFNSSEKLSGGGAGVNIGSNGLSPYFSVYGMKGKGKGTSVSYTGTEFKAENKITAVTGDGDFILDGSTIKAKKAELDINGDLKITTKQDKENFNYDTTSWSASGSMTPKAVSGTVGGGINKNKFESDWRSVTEQAGIYIGDGGITADIRGKTILEGGIIESRVTKDKNIFNTGTIEWKDIANKSRYSSKEKGIAVQKTFGNTEGMNQEDKAWEGITPNMGQNIKGKDSSTTQSAVSESITLNITDKDRQKQDINELRRNTENTTNTLEANPTKEETDEKRELASITQQFLHDVMGDLKESGAISKDLGAFLNVAVSGIATGFAGGDIKSGLVGGITTEALQKALEKVDPDLRKLVAGIVAGTVAEGIGLDGSTAGNTGVAVELYNELTHKRYNKVRDENSDEKSIGKIRSRETEIEKEDENNKKKLENRIENDQDFLKYVFDEQQKQGGQIEGEYDGYVFSGVTYRNGTWVDAGYQVAQDENGTYTLQEWYKPHRSEVVAPVVLKGAGQAIGGGIEIYTGIMSLISGNPLGLAGIVDGGSSIGGGISDIINIQRDKNLNLNYEKRVLDKHIGQGTYESIQGFYGFGDLAYNSIRYGKLSMLNKLAIVIDTINLYNIMKEMQESKDVRKNGSRK